MIARLKNVISKSISDLLGYPKLSLPDPGDTFDHYWMTRGPQYGRIGPWKMARFDLARSYILQYETKELIDFGGGGALFGRYLRERCPEIVYTLWEVSPICVRIAQEAGYSAERIEPEIFKAPVANNRTSADCIVAFEVLEHVADSELLLNFLFSIARRTVIFSVPNSAYVKHRLRMMFGRVPVQWIANPSEHLRFWSVTDMTWWLESLGYKYEIKPYMGIPILSRFLPNLFSAGILVVLEK